MMVHFRCPEGHRLKANAFLIGKTVACPACNSHVVVPHRSGDPLTDSAVVRLLDDHPKATITNPDAEEKQCTGCGSIVPASFRICPFCDLQFD